MKVVISGSSSGLGKTIAEHLRTLGHEVFGLSRSEGTDVRNFISTWTAHRIEADALICCAGILRDEPFATSEPAAWADAIQTNLMGTYNCLRSYPAPRIICFSGGGAPEPLKGFSAYNVSKTAVVSLVQNYALENPDICINAIAPGAFQTGMSDVGETNPARLLALVHKLLAPELKVSGRLISLRHDAWESADWWEQLEAWPYLCTLERRTKHYE